MDCREKEYPGATWLEISGRIDGMTSPEIERKMDTLILAGGRRLVLDLEKVNYISSAGLRVLLSALKQLNKIDGSMILYRPSPNVLDVIQMTGFHEIIPISESAEQIDRMFGTTRNPEPFHEKEIDGLQMTFAKKNGPPSSCFLIGSQDKTAKAGYAETDVVTVQARDIPFGFGLAAMGDSYSEYGNYFGESIVVNNSLFFYPAVKQPAVDFMICADRMADVPYRFLHGFGFGPEHHCDVSIRAEDRPVTLKQMVAGFFEISQSNLIGIQFLSQCHEVWGMNLKKVPLLENRPENQREIFDPANFAQWINFPIEPEGTNQILIGVGAAVRNRDQTLPALSKLFPDADNFHIHAGLFAKGPLGNQLRQMDDEMTRILTDADAIKVQHLMGKTRLKNTLARIFELKE